MEYPKEYKHQGNSHIVNFSDSKAFIFEGINFRIYKNNKEGKNFPDYVLMNDNTDKRLSGLFCVGFNKYRGDILNDYGKEIFYIHFLNEGSIELEGFLEALTQGGYITTKTDNRGLLQHLTASESKGRGLFE